jgi:hypothetical protein
MRKGQLPVRDDVTEITYHRNPTKGEIARGYGAIHYRVFSISECCFPDTRFKKTKFKCKDDGLMYYY